MTDPLVNPAGDATMTLRDGRRITWRDYGAAQGLPLLVLHGFPGSRLQAALLEDAARAHGVRLIAPDRPGFGGSSPAPGRSLLSYAGDIAQLADALALPRFGVVGISCGGAYALALANAIPERLAYVGLLAGMGPMDLPTLRRDQHPALRLMFGLARVHPALASPMFALDRWLFRNHPERALRAVLQMLSGADRHLFETNRSFAAHFIAGMAEAYRAGIGGAMTEAALIAAPRGYDLASIAVPVRLHQGTEDRHVPTAMARHVAQEIPAASLRLYRGEGHASILMAAAATVMGEFRKAHAPDPATA